MRASIVRSVAITDSDGVIFGPSRLRIPIGKSWPSCSEKTMISLGAPCGYKVVQIFTLPKGRREREIDTKN